MNSKITLKNRYSFGNNIELYFDFLNKAKTYSLLNQTVFILGDPIINDKINFSLIIDKIEKNQFSNSFIKNIDGEFLIIIVGNNKSVEIINDRFSSIPIFYSLENKKFRASINFLTLFRKIKNKKLNHNKFLEFLYFQRIHGEDTYESSIKSLNSATKIKFDQGIVNQTKYWYQSYKKDYYLSIDDYSKILSDLIYKSIDSKISDIDINENFGLFLSGGMDSRTVLGSFKKKRPTAFTLGFSEFGEYRVSKKITKIISNKHNLIKLDKDHFSKNFDKLIHLCSGLYRFDHGIFCGIEKEISKVCKIVINSTALDYWFQGYYIPKINLKLFNKPTYFNRMRDQVGKFEEDYFMNIPYKFKNVNPLDYIISTRKKNDAENFIKNEIKKIYDLGMKNGCYNFYDAWDYILNDNISRHFSYSNNLSMHASCEPRTVAFYNRIFDLFLKIPAEYRFGAKVSKKTLKRVNYKFSKVISANHGMKITASPLEMTLHTIFKKIMSKFSNSKIFKHPTAEDRTWPDSYNYLKNNKFLYQKAIDLKSSDYLISAIPDINMDKLNKDIDIWLANDRNGADLIYRLISINEFLKMGYN